MALIKCNKCGKNISDKATKCVHCGAKVLSEEEYIKKLEHKKKIKKTGKQIKVFTLILGSIIGIFICYIALGLILPVKSIDFTIKYKNYLDYALGDDWSIINIEKSRNFKNLWFHEYKYWTISYLDKNNERQTLKIDNSDLKFCKKEELCSDYVFASSIVYYYRFKLNEILSTGNISELDEYINIIDIYNVDRNLYAKDSLKLINDKNGLSFKDISLDKLDSNYYYLELDVLYNYGDDINNYTINESKKIMEKYNIKNAIISAGMINDNIGETFPIYCVKDNKEISCPSETELGSMNNAIMNKENYILVK